MRMRVFLIYSTIILGLLYGVCVTNGYSIDISHDGMAIEVPVGQRAVKKVTLLNREASPRWVRAQLSTTGPITPEQAMVTFNADTTARGWTHVKEGWIEVPAQKLLKYTIEFLPPSKLKPGNYSVWLVFEQLTERPKVQGEEQRGAVLSTQLSDVYYLPVVVNVVSVEK